MSLDNVIAVAAAAGGHWVLMIIGLAISIPLVIFGATLLVKLMDRWPIIIIIGAGLLGFVAGEMAWEDGAIASLTRQYPRSPRRGRGDRRSLRGRGRTHPRGTHAAEIRRGADGEPRRS